jgi:hypothetical protein
MGRNYGPSSRDTWRFRLCAFIGIALCFYVLATVERGGLSRLREWQGGDDRSMPAMVHDYAVAAQRWVMGVQYEAHWRGFSADLQRRTDETMPMVRQWVSALSVTD